MTGPRRLSQAVSEGEGISILALVADRAAAAAAAADGAHAIALDGEVIGVRDETGLALLWTTGSARDAQAAGADAVVVPVRSLDGPFDELVEEARELGLECVVRVVDEDELQAALERVDPEVVLLAAEDDEESPLAHLLDLLPDVPAGKLAIAELREATGDDIDELERAGFDAVLVAAPAA